MSLFDPDYHPYVRITQPLYDGRLRLAIQSSYPPFLDNTPSQNALGLMDLAGNAGHLFCLQKSARFVYCCESENILCKVVETKISCIYL